MRFGRWDCLAAALTLLLVPLTAGAQTSSSGQIAGVVRDTTGAVLPGVTVEASSPALIEKVRTVVTDAQGNYKIVELRPGVYTVTFTLAGFSVVRRQGIELTSGLSATANAEMAVGSLEESVTVTGASPIVDVQNVRTQNVLSQQALDTVPNNKTIYSFAALTVGVTLASPTNQDVGGNQGEVAGSLSIHGSAMNDTRLLFDGMVTNHVYGAGGGSNRSFTVNQAGVQETVLETGGYSAQSETGGVQINFVPKDGGNTFTGYFAGNYSNSNLQNRNLTDELTARGVLTAPSIKDVFDWGGGIGGPIARDRLWFYSAHRRWGAMQYVPGSYYNASPNPLVYVANLDDPGYTGTDTRDHTIRLAWQAASKHKLTFFYEWQKALQNDPYMTGVTAPEAIADYDFGPTSVTQGAWTFPATNRVLFEAGLTDSRNNVKFPYHRGSGPDIISVRELSTGFTWGSQGGPGNQNGYGNSYSNQLNTRASVAYVTGSHAFKAGLFTLFGHQFNNHSVNQAISYEFLRGVPASLNQFASPYVFENGVTNVGLYVQDQWTIGQLTVSPGVRFDRLNGHTYELSVPATRFLPARQFPEINDVPSWRDISPRLGMAYDLFGNGKTAFKGSYGRYVASQGVGIAQSVNPAFTIVTSTNRTWLDGNGNFAPDCNLNSPDANGECGAMTNRAFGQPIINTRFAPDYLTGWSSRPFNWQATMQLQHELRPGMALNVGYFRKWLGNFTVTQNVAVAADDFTTYCVTAPGDSRLPDGGGNQICGLYDVNPARFGQVSNLVTQAANFGDQSQVFNGVDLTLNARFGEGKGLLSGGVSTGQTVTDNCFVSSLPNVLAQAQLANQPRHDDYCHVAPAWSSQTQLKLFGSYPLAWGVETSATLQNLPGIPYGANLVATNAAIAPSLGRNLAAGPNATVTIPLIQPNSAFEERLTQLDIRFTKVLRVGRLKAKGMFDIYNVFNANTVLAVSSTYNASWRRPAVILGARLFKFGTQIDF